MKYKGIFITGTGTDVGKTFGASLLLYWFRAAGINAAPMKPVQTGCVYEGEKLLSPDLEYSLKLGGLKPVEQELSHMSPYQYIPPCSPHLAGRQAGNFPDLESIQSSFDYLSRRYELVLPEGAGGLMVPFDESGTTTLDLIRQLALPVILVASTGLGTINHTLLTLDRLAAEKVPLLGILFTHTSPVTEENRFIREDNPRIIKKLRDVPVFGVIRHIPLADFNEENLRLILREDCPVLESILSEGEKLNAK